jgi:hypothetical protein
MVDFGHTIKRRMIVDLPGQIVTSLGLFGFYQDASEIRL